MDRNPETRIHQMERVNFMPWFAEGKLSSCSFDIGEIAYGTDGAFRLTLRGESGGVVTQAELAFHAPLAIRIVGEGSLMDYWNAGFVVRDHNVFVADDSAFLQWLENSSSGVHKAGPVKHYAVFSDDICVEVLSREAPEVVATR